MKPRLFSTGQSVVLSPLGIKLWGSHMGSGPKIGRGIGIVALNSDGHQYLVTFNDGQLYLNDEHLLFFTGANHV